MLLTPMTDLAASPPRPGAPGQILVGAETATAAGCAFTLRLFGEGIWALEPVVVASLGVDYACKLAPCCS